jgi:hypothetical protein
MTKSKNAQRWEKKIASLSVLRLFLIYTIIVFGLTNNVFGQTATWQYVTTVTGGSKLYYKNDIKVLANKNLSVWQLVIMPDKSFAVALEEWDCGNKRRVARQITFYRADATVIGTRKQSEWNAVIPGSSADYIFRRVCLPATTIRWAQITAVKANLRSLPDANAPVLRIAERGEKFQLIEDIEQDGWFNIVDADTQEDYWIRGSTFKILSESSDIKQRKR